jgi:hypothetical protein
MADLLTNVSPRLVKNNRYTSTSAPTLRHNGGPWASLTIRREFELIELSTQETLNT